MNRRIPDHKRPALISKPAALLTLVVTLLMLYILFPRTLFFEHEQQQPKDAALAAAYLKAALAQNPNDPKLKLKLADVELQAGQWAEAMHLLGGLPPSPAVTRMHSKLLFHRWQDTGAKADDPLLTTLRDSLKDVSIWNDESLQYAKAAGMNDAVARYLKTQGRVLEAAHFWMAAGKPGRATDLYQGRVNARNVDDAVTAALAANRPLQAYQWWQKHGDGELARTYQLARLAGDTTEAERAIRALLAKNPNDRKLLQQAMQASLANGDIRTAQRLTDQLLARDPDNAKLYYQNWQLKRWLNDAGGALYDMRWLMRHGKAKIKDVESSLHDAIGLFRFDDVTHIFRYLAHHQRLSATQIDQWIDAHRWQGDPQQLMADIRFYQQRWGKTLQTQQWEAETYNNLGELDALIALWPHYQGPRDEQALSWFARAFWLKGQPQKSLRVLKTLNKSDDQDFWQLRATLAWQLNDKPQSLLAYQQLRRLGINSPEIERRYQQLRYADDKPGLLAYLWTLPVSVETSNQIAELAWQLKDADSFSRLSARLNSQPPASTLATAWLYQSMWYQYQRQFALAAEALSKAEYLNPTNDDVLQGKGWLALASNDEQTIRAVFAAHRQDPPSLLWAPLMASLAQRLQQWPSAYFYLHLLAQQQPDNLPVLANLAEVMRQMGWQDQAYRLDRYLAEKLPQDDTAYAELMLRWQGEQVLPALHGHFSMATLAPMAPSQAVASWWLHRTGARHLEAWQQLQLAMHDGRFHDVNQLARSGTLTPLDEVNAWLYLRRPYRAMSRWQARITGLPSEDALDLARAARPHHFRALALSWQPKAGLNSSQWGMDLYLPFAEGQWHLGAGYQRNQGNNGALLALAGDWQLGRWHLNAGVDHHQGVIAKRTGLHLGADYQWDNRTTLGLSFDDGAESRQSDNLLAFGEQRQWQLWGQYQLDGRQQLQLAVSELTLALRNGPTLGSGQQFDGRYQFAVLKDRPGWTAYTSATWQKFPDKPPLPIPGQPGREVTLESFRRFAIGSVFGPGAELTPPHLGAEPAWLLDISVGYQPQVHQGDIAVTGGIGWSLLGDDLLKLQLSYQSSNRVGAADTQLTLGYYFHF
ncbi:tetratricopeptide repeat protein [Gallaecimonas sp. GXIMD1310]|uniref:tetratricopeptide repeat protein n=1 Tax=Gallaecimonas sp. GXIMD1310 TaxID=3131926 RepID=UPI003245D6E3